jgi:ABC-2 type transport system permease protein
VAPDEQEPKDEILATGLVGYNVLWTCVISGNLVWNDRRNGMFDQILGMPYTRFQYIVSNLLTVILMGLVGSAAVIAIGSPTLWNYVSVSPISIFYTLAAIILCSLVFGSIVIIMSISFENLESLSFQIESGLINGIFHFLSFTSNVFYPASVLPGIFETVIYVNPLTCVVNVIRDAILLQITSQTVLSVMILAIVSLAIVSIASFTMERIKI